MPFLLIEDEGRNKIYDITKEKVSIGRGSNNDVVLKSDSVSRNHCEIASTPIGYKIKDLDSRNGTTVNGTKIQEWVLNDKDEIKVGDIIITYTHDKPIISPIISQLTEPLTIYDEKTKILLDTIIASSQSPELDRFLPLVVDNIIKITGAERGIIIFKAGNEYEIKLSRDDKSNTIEDVADFSHSIPQKVIESGEPVFIQDISDDKTISRSAVKLQLKSIMCVPLRVGLKTYGALYVDSHSPSREFAQSDLALFSMVANHIALAIENVRANEQKLIDDEFKRQELEKENIILKGLLAKRSQIIGESPHMQAVYEVVKKSAPTGATILIEGESGTGKEAIAHLIHDLSDRSSGPFVVVDCAAIPETLLESELFGYEKGAFTGAVSQKKGKFEVADNGTIFLDEVAELSAALQSKLLRVLQEKQIVRVGGLQQINVNLRVIAATNKKLADLVKNSKFRQDLYFRLNVIPIKMPPLRERGHDIILLAQYFLDETCTLYNRSVNGFTTDARDQLLKYNWPGNVRELKNRIEQAVILTNNKELTPDDLNVQINPSMIRHLDVVRDNFEKQYIYNALEANNHNVTHTAKTLGITRQHLQNLMKKYNL